MNLTKRKQQQQELRSGRPGPTEQSDSIWQGRQGGISHRKEEKGEWKETKKKKTKANKEKKQQEHETRYEKNIYGNGIENKIQANLNTVTTNTNTNTNNEHTVLNSDEVRDIKAATQSQQDNKDIDGGERKVDMKNTVKFQIEKLTVRLVILNGQLIIFWMIRHYKLQKDKCRTFNNYSERLRISTKSHGWWRKKCIWMKK